MKIGVCGDVHLGASLQSGTKDPVTGMFSRLVDYYNTLIFTIEDIAKQTDIMVFTGDIFEHRSPSMQQQQLFSKALRHGLNKGLKKIYILEGNHDQSRSLGTSTISYLEELRLPEIEIVSDIRRVDIGNDCLYFLPYRDRRFYETTVYSEAIIKLKAELDAVKKETTGNSLLIGHMAIEGTFFGEEDSELYTDNELMLPKALFSDFSYSLFGHVHTPGQISVKPAMAYIGSMEKRAAHEKGNKVYAIVDLAEKSIDFKKEPCRDFFEFGLDFSDKTYGTDLMTVILEKMSKLCTETDISGSILKVNLKLLADDMGQLDIVKINDVIRMSAPNFVFPIVPVFVSQRAFRSEAVETTSDAGTWAKYIKATVTNKSLADLMVEYGKEILSEVKA